MGISFRTVVDIEKPDFTIGYKTPAMFIGSCFSDHIGGELKRLKFPVLLNPFGVLYNPSSISRVLNLVLQNQTIGHSDLIFHNNQWHSFLLHGSFSHPDANVVIEKANKTVAETNVFLKNASYLFVTFGTAWVFNFKNTGEIVSNCHKIPAFEFDRYRLSISDIVDEWSVLLEALQQFNPDLKVIFTISPVRHLKDGAHENQLSKSALLLATDSLIAKFDSTSYFPSYEIVHDELRDYRFYAPDMVHVADVAVQYIFEKFAMVYFDKFSIECMGYMLQLIKAIEHRIDGKEVQSLEKFRSSMLKKLSMLEVKYPHIDFSYEKKHFENL